MSGLLCLKNYFTYNPSLVVSRFVLTSAQSQQPQDQKQHQCQGFRRQNGRLGLKSSRLLRLACVFTLRNGHHNELRNSAYWTTLFATYRWLLLLAMIHLRLYS